MDAATYTANINSIYRKTDCDVSKWMKNWPVRTVVEKEWHCPPTYFNFNMDNHHIRSQFVKKYSFAIPSQEALQLISRYSPILEVGAGSGLWSKLLMDMDCDVIATDIDSAKDPNHFKKKFCKINSMSAWAAVKRYGSRNIFISWPSYGAEWALKMLREVRDQYVIYIGEGECCATDGFFELLGKEFFHIESMAIPQFDGVYDYLKVWRKKSA